MSTRSITVVKNDVGDKIIEMYNHFDGAPCSYGTRLREFVERKLIVNGLGSGDVEVANGIECLAAQIVDEFKVKPGGTYLHAPTEDFEDKKKYKELYGALYYYEVNLLSNGTPKVSVWSCFTGSEIGFDEQEA